jgi:surfactin synthase thioesterase subunit/acyl carrier protein
MSARANEIQLLTKLGFHLMSPEQAIGIMESLLLADATRAVVTDIDWRQFQSFVNFSTNPLFFEKLSVETSAAKSPDGVAGVETEWIKTAPRGEALARLRLLVRQHLSAVLLLEPGREVDVSQRFNLMGMDSLMAIAFALRLENIAGMRLPTALAYNYPTIQDVAEHLFELIRGEKPLESMTTGAEPTSLKVSPPPTRRQLWFPSLNGHDAAAPLRLFCFPYAGAGVSVYQPWLESLLPLAEVVPVQLPGREARSGEPLISEMRELASALAGAVEELRPAPFAFFGHSMGAMVCFETARELRRRGADLPQLLILSACVAPNAQRETQLHELSDDEFKKELVKNFEMPVEAVADEMIWQALLPSLRSDIRLLELYEPSDEPPLEVPICVFGGAHDPVASREHLLAWSAFTSVDFSLRLFSGSHMFVRSQGEEVQKAIRRELSSSTVCDRAGAAVRAVVPAAPVTGGE